MKSHGVPIPCISQINITEWIQWIGTSNHHFIRNKETGSCDLNSNPKYDTDQHNGFNGIQHHEHLIHCFTPFHSFGNKKTIIFEKEVIDDISWGVNFFFKIFLLNYSVLISYMKYLSSIRLSSHKKQSSNSPKGETNEINNQLKSGV